MDNRKIIRFGPLQNSPGLLSQCEQDLLNIINSRNRLAPTTSNQLEYRSQKDGRLLVTLSIDANDRVYCVAVEDWHGAMSEKWDWKFLQWLMPHWHGVAPVHMARIQGVVSALVSQAAASMNGQQVAKSTVCWVPDPGPDGTDTRQVEFVVTRVLGNAVTLVARYLDQNEYSPAGQKESKETY